MECKKDVPERNGDSPTTAALFSLCRFFFFFVLTPKSSAARFVGDVRGSGKQQQHRPTRQSFTQIARGTCCDLGLRISAGVGVGGGAVGSGRVEH